MKYGIQWNYENKAPLENLCDFDLKSWNLPALKYVLIFIFIFIFQDSTAHNLHSQNNIE